MKKSTIGRYINLITHIRNWELYFLRKFKSGYPDLLFVTRRRNLKLTAPAKSLYLVFKEIFVNDVYEMKKLAARLPEQPVVVDIGSNVGYFSLALLSYKPAAKIYAYDAVAANEQLFRRHLDMNPQLKPYVTAHHRAVTGTPQDFITLYTETDHGNSVTASVYKDFIDENVYAEKVPCISLKEIMEQNGIDHADLLKIDCEGSEYPIIYETPASFWQQVDRLAMEVHDLDGQTRNAGYLQNYLAGFGFSFYSFPLGHSTYMLFAEKKP